MPEFWLRGSHCKLIKSNIPPPPQPPCPVMGGRAHLLSAPEEELVVALLS